jgi:hypothetical protein
MKACSECQLAALCLIGHNMNVFAHSRFSLADGTGHKASAEIETARLLPKYRAVPDACPRALHPEKERLLL